MNFVIDKDASDVTVTSVADGLICSLSSCGVDASLALVDGYSFDLAEGETASFDFLTFSGQNTGGAAYTISATLAFTSPAFDATGDGFGGVLLLAGNIIGGVLHWTNMPTVVVLADGSKVKIDFEDGLTIFDDSNVTTGASVKLKYLAPQAVPLPATGLMLVGGLGAIGALRRRRKAA